jgi:hypothetical protein
VNAKRKSRYSGALNQPIVLPLGLLYRPTSPIGAKGILRTRLIKLLLLLDHYNIKPNDPACWLKLAFLLAQVHVPGMKVVENAPRGPGAPKKQLDVSGARENVRIIDEINRERGKKGVMGAIRVALKRKQLMGSPDSLEARYYENKDLLRRVEELERRLPKGFDPNSKWCRPANSATNNCASHFFVACSARSSPRTVPGRRGRQDHRG